MSSISIGSRYHPYSSISSRSQDGAPDHSETRLNKNITEVMPDSIKEKRESRQGEAAVANTNEVTLIDQYLASISKPKKEECDLAKKILYRMEADGFLKEIENCKKIIKKSKYNQNLIGKFKNYLKGAETKYMQNIIIDFFSQRIESTAGYVREKLIKYEFGDSAGIKHISKRPRTTQESLLSKEFERLGWANARINNA